MTCECGFVSVFSVELYFTIASVENTFVWPSNSIHASTPDMGYEYFTVTELSLRYSIQNRSFTCFFWDEQERCIPCGICWFDDTGGKLLDEFLLFKFYDFGPSVIWCRFECSCSWYQVYGVWGDINLSEWTTLHGFMFLPHSPYIQMEFAIHGDWERFCRDVCFSFLGEGALSVIRQWRINHFFCFCDKRAL